MSKTVVMKREKEKRGGWKTKHCLHYLQHWFLGKDSGMCWGVDVPSVRVSGELGGGIGPVMLRDVLSVSTARNTVWHQQINWDGLQIVQFT